MASNRDDPKRNKPVQDSGTGRLARPSVRPATESFQSRFGRTGVRLVPKPWGHETIWAATDRYVGKILHIKAGHALSMQYHKEKDETIYVLSGELIYRVQNGPNPGDMKEMKLCQGHGFRAMPGTIHQMEALTDCQVLEASTPHLNDVVRLKDRYGRAGSSEA